MPKVTIWIRVDDWHKWQAIKDRPSFIHNALNPEAHNPAKAIAQHVIGQAERSSAILEKIAKPIKTPTVNILEQAQDEIRDAIDKQNIEAGNETFGIKPPKE